MSMSPQSVWRSMGDGDQRAAVVDRIPRLGYVFRCIVSGKTKSRFIEFKGDADKWHMVCLAPKKWKVTINDKEAE